MDNNWVMAFGMAHAPLSLTYFPFKKRTYRLIINSAISGTAARVRLSNKYSNCAVSLEKLSIARCNKNGELIGSMCKLTFGGKSARTLRGGESVISDSTCISVSPNDYLAITFLVTAGDMKSGNALRSADLIFCNGDKAEEKSIPDDNRPRTKLIKAVTQLAGIQQPMPIPLIEAVELDNCENAKAIVCFGDSIMQEGKWTGFFEEAVREKHKGQYSVINMSITGNRLQYDCSKKFILKGFFGVSALNRAEENVFAYDNVSHAIIGIGINDILQPGTIGAPKSELPVPEDFFNSLTKLFNLFAAHKIRTLAMNYLPVGRCPDCRKYKEIIRVKINERLDNADFYDGFVDMDALLEDPQRSGYAIREMICRDKLHPNAQGGRTIANAIPLDFFADRAASLNAREAVGEKL